MAERPPARRLRTVRLRRCQAGAASTWTDDDMVVEEPLELRIDGRPTAVTMRTPGEDFDLVAGFLFSEGVVDGIDDIEAMAFVDDPADPRGNTVDVVLAPGVPAGRRHAADRDLFASSACGVCGKASIDRLVRNLPPLAVSAPVTGAVLCALPERLR